TTGLALEPGCRMLDGPTALALARSRHVEVRDHDGTWRADRPADLGRAARQQVVATAAVRGVGHLQAGDVLSLTRSLLGHLVADVELDLGAAGELARWAGSLPPDAVSSMTPRVERRTVDGADVL